MSLDGPIFVGNGLLHTSAALSFSNPISSKLEFLEDGVTMNEDIDGLEKHASGLEPPVTSPHPTMEEPIFFSGNLLTSKRPELQGEDPGSYTLQPGSADHPAFVTTLISARPESPISDMVEPTFFLPSNNLLSNQVPPDPPFSSMGDYLPSKYHVQATTFSGKTLYIRRKTKRTARNALNATAAAASRMGNLLDIPIHRLLDNLSRDKAVMLSNFENVATPTPSKYSKPETSLWVDLYRPRQFTDLMGNERVARDAMTWVKRWDWCVFGKRKILGKRAREENGEETLDEFKRPKEKVLLLSGPPGLGKTTLAHVVAKQAGYEVLEINASDARTGQIVDDRIRPALESGSALGSSKPVLLVIDEIDGATGSESGASFIQRLVQLITERPVKKGRSRSAAGRPQTHRPILRPIICICNDINASALTKLRPLAYQLRMQRPADVHTVKRLKEICDFEGLKADSRALSTLVGLARGDLRGCINALQFIKSRNESVTELVIRRATAGLKEAETSVVSVLNDLFSPLSKKRIIELGLTDGAENQYVARLCQDIDACGREGAIAVGCFAHYASLRRHDATLVRFEKANDWLSTFDLFSSIMYTGEFALGNYLPYTLVAFYPLFSERGAPRIERDNTDWENLQVTRGNEEIYKSLARCLQNATTRRDGDYRHLLTTPILQLEFAPFINRIISPPLRPVNSQVIKTEERALLQRLVQIMLSLDLRFVQERAEDGQLTYRLDPSIDVFVTYDGKRAANIPVSRYAVRHLVAKELDTELSKHVDIIDKGKKGKHSLFSSAEKSPNKARNNGADSEHPNKKARIDNTIDIADRPATDFFGRLITIPSGEGTAKSKVDAVFRVSYKFVEGNSAAVRKPVKVDAFL